MSYGFRLWERPQQPLNAKEQFLLFNENRYRGNKTFSCSTQLSMKFFPLINVKMPTIVGILTFMSRKNGILSLSEPEKC